LIFELVALASAASLVETQATATVHGGIVYLRRQKVAKTHGGEEDIIILSCSDIFNLSLYKCCTC
jgi:hypothetical protein